ncbi:hypothetical protein X801_05349, partial [Opisthorchis viverrini]
PNSFNVTQERSLRAKTWLLYSKFIVRLDKTRRTPPVPNYSAIINEPASGPLFFETNLVPILTTQIMTQSQRPASMFPIVREIATVPNCTIMQHFITINIKWIPQQRTHSSPGGVLFCNTCSVDLSTHSKARCALECSVLVVETQAPGVIDAYEKVSVEHS